MSLVKSKTKKIVLITTSLIIGYGIYCFGYINGENDPSAPIANRAASSLSAEFPISETGLLQLVNKEREKASLHPLQRNDKLSSSAKAKCSDMVVRNYWSHQTPDGTLPWAFIKNEGYQYRTVGENLARGYQTNEQIVSAWMNSETHKAEVLDKSFTESGVAICVMNQNEILVVEHFGTTL